MRLTVATLSALAWLALVASCSSGQGTLNQPDQKSPSPDAGDAEQAGDGVDAHMDMIGQPTDLALKDQAGVDAEDASQRPDDTGTSDVVTPFDAAELLDGADTSTEDAEQPDEISEPPDLVDPTLPLPLLNEIGCHGDDFVELFNASTQAVADLSGYVLSDGAEATHQYLIPQGTVLLPQGRLVLVKKSNVMPGFPFGIQCGVDTLQLLDPNGQVVDEIGLPLVLEGNTYSRLPDGKASWAESAFTPNQVNQLPVDLEGILFNPLQVATITIDLPPASVTALAATPDSYVSGTLSLASGDFVQGPLPVGVRLKGVAGTARTLEQKPSLKLKFNFGDPEARLLGLKKLTLNSMAQDPSMIHETLAYRIFRAFDVASPRTGNAEVRINGELYGLYLILEPYDDVTLTRHFASMRHLFEGNAGVDVLPDQVGAFDIDEGSETDISDLTTLTTIASNASDIEWLSTLESAVDLPGLLRMWAVEQVIGHWDGYAAGVNNYYLHSDDDDVFTMMPNGVDQTFVEPLDVHQGVGVLFVRCMGIPECRHQYDQTVEALLPLLESLELPAFAQQLSEYLKPWIVADPRKPYTSVEAQAWAEGTGQFLEQRGEELAQALAGWL